MAINKFMMAALKALSNTEYSVKENYKLHRAFHNMMHPPVRKPDGSRTYAVTRGKDTLPVRVFMPKKIRSDEIILFFHGGGWVLGDADSYSRTCMDLANETGRQVHFPEYRLAPEHPFPCALEDCYATAKELFQKHRGVVLMGDSAGGNLAAAVSLMAADRGEYHVGKQILLYPPTYHDHTSRSPFLSVHENGADYLLTAKMVCDYEDLYVPDQKDRMNPYFAPLLAENLHGQPDTLIVTAEYDLLRDEGEAYGEKLRQFGNSVSCVRLQDALHGFFSLPRRFAHVRRCHGIINAFLEGEHIEDNTIIRLNCGQTSCPPAALPQGK